MKKNGNPACFDKETLLVTCHSYLSRLIMIAKTENETKILKTDYKI